MEGQKATKEQGKEIFSSRKASMINQKLHPNEECRKDYTKKKMRRKVCTSSKPKCIVILFFNIAGTES